MAGSFPHPFSLGLGLSKHRGVSKNRLAETHSAISGQRSLKHAKCQRDNQAGLLAELEGLPSIRLPALGGRAASRRYSHSGRTEDAERLLGVPPLVAIRRGAQSHEFVQTERSFLRYPRLVQTDQISGFEQDTDFRHAEISGLQVGDA
jgi:hypothetical protein